MNNSLIPVFAGTIASTSIQLVNARELHSFLEVGKDFSNWMKDRIAQYEFTENQDYILTVAKTGVRSNVIQKEYHITLDMAKELSMVERNAKGKQARLYFIECEKQAKQPTYHLPQTLSEALLLAGQLAADNEQLEAKNALALAQVETQAQEIEILEPKAQALDRLSSAEGSMNITAAAKVLKMQPSQLFKFLSEKRWIYRSAGGKAWLGYQDRIRSGYLEHNPTTVKRPDGSEKVVEQVLVTAKGLAKLSTMLNTQPTLLDRAISLVTGKRNGLVVMKGSAK